MNQTKRQRIENSEDPGLVASLDCLTGPPKLQPWRDVVSQWDRRSSIGRPLSLSSYVSLHRCIVLHIGYLSLGSNTDSIGEEVLVLLFYCWRRLLNSQTSVSPSPSKRSVFDLIERDEIEESVELLVRSMTHHYTVPSVLNFGVDIADAYMKHGNNKPRTMTMTNACRACNDVNFLLCFVRVVGRDKGVSADAKEKAMELLKKVTSNHDSTGELSTGQVLYACARFILSRTDDNPNLLIECNFSSYLAEEEERYQILGKALFAAGGNIGVATKDIEMHHVVLFLRGLCCSQTLAQQLSESATALQFLCDELMTDSASENLELACEEADCISRIICAGSPKLPERLTLPLIEVICKTHLAVAKRCLAGLIHATDKSNANTELLQTYAMELVPRLEEILHSSTQRRGDPNHCQGQTTKLLCRIATTLSSHTTSYSSKLDFVLTSIASALPTIVTSPVRNHALTTMRQVSMHPRFRHSLGASFKIPTAIALTAMDDFGTWETKSLAVKILYNLSQEPSNRQILVRQSKVIDALIAIVGSSHVDADSNPNKSRLAARQFAVQTLLQLASLVSNRRILAKQAGLLSCLIRYARSMTVSDERRLDCTKDVLKHDILKMATLL